MNRIQVWDEKGQPTPKGGHGGDKSKPRTISLKDASEAIKSKHWVVAKTSEVYKKDKDDNQVKSEIVFAIMPFVEKPKRNEAKAAKELAEEYGIDISLVTGPAKIEKKHVQKYIDDNKIVKPEENPKD